MNDATNLDAVVFEDDPMAGELISSALMQVCDAVEHCMNLDDLRKYRATVQKCPAVVWLDIFAPGNTPNDIFELIREIRKACRNSIIVVMTGSSLPEIREDAIEAGADAFETKPFKTGALDIARLIGIGAINAIKRGATDSPVILRNVCSMAVKIYEGTHTLVNPATI